MSLSLPKELNDHARKMFDFLRDSKGFNIVRSVFEERMFGNIQVIASCSEFAVDYRLDRGDESVFVVVEGNEYLIEDASRSIDGATLETHSIRDEESWVMSHDDALRESLHGERLKVSKQLLEQSRIERLRRMFPGAVIGS